MLIAGSVGALIGLALGRGCRVLALVPAHLAGVLIAVGAMMGGAPAGRTAVAWVAASVAANLFYLLGAVLRPPLHPTDALSARRLRRAPF